MQNKKLLVLIVLTIVAVITWIYGLTATPMRKRKPSIAPQAIRQVERKQAGRGVIQGKGERKKSRYITLGRNPFIPKGTKAVEFRKLILNGVAWDEEGYKAVINNTVVEIGDKIGKNTIIDIRKNSVILNDGVSNFEIMLAE